MAETPPSDSDLAPDAVPALSPDPAPRPYPVTDAAPASRLAPRPDSAPSSGPDIHSFEQRIIDALSTVQGVENASNVALFDTLGAELVADIKGRIEEFRGGLTVQDIGIIDGLLEDGANVDKDQLVAEYIAIGIFMGIIEKHFKLQSIRQFPKDREDCFIAITQSRSFVSGGPSEGKRKWFKRWRSRNLCYYPCPSRTNVSKKEWSRDGDLEHDVSVRQPIRFIPGILATSPVSRILIVPSVGEDGNPEQRIEAVGTSICLSIGGIVGRPKEKD